MSDVDLKISGTLTFSAHNYQEDFMDQTRTLSRAELYEKVWNTPMRKLAAEFGMSDVGLANICRRNGIPLPGLGYWRLAETGHPLKKQALPPLESGQCEEIRILVHEPKPYEVILTEKLESVPKIEVAENREITHPLVIRTRKLFQPVRKDAKGFIVPSKLKAPHLQITSSCLPRALRILDALFCSVEERGYVVTWSSSDDKPLTIQSEGESIGVMLFEIFDRKDHVLSVTETAQRQKSPYSWHGPKYIASGSLRLSFDNLPNEITHIRKSWSDGKTRRVEDCLGEFVALLPRLTKSLKLIHEERERECQRRLEEQKREEEQRRRREEYNEHLKIVTKFIEEWQQSEKFRHFAVALNQQLEISSAENEEKEQIRAIADWAAQHATNTNPILYFKWMIQQYNQPSWHYGF